MTHYLKGKRDANEREMVEAWRALGALWIPQAEAAGFDGLLITAAGDVYFVEIKDIKRGHKTYYLTANESVACYDIRQHGRRYEVVTTMEQALRLVGAS